MTDHDPQPTPSCASASPPSSTRSPSTAAPSGPSPASTGTATTTASTAASCATRPLFSLRHQVRVGHRLAELLGRRSTSAVEHRDRRSHGMVRTEALCAQLRRPPRPRVRRRPRRPAQRYCMNSASLRLDHDAAVDQEPRLRPTSSSAVRLTARSTTAVDALRGGAHAVAVGPPPAQPSSATSDRRSAERGAPGERLGDAVPSPAGVPARSARCRAARPPVVVDLEGELARRAPTATARQVAGRSSRWPSRSTWPRNWPPADLAGGSLRATRPRGPGCGTRRSRVTCAGSPPASSADAATRSRPPRRAWPRPLGRSVQPVSAQADGPGPAPGGAISAASRRRRSQSSTEMVANWRTRSGRRAGGSWWTPPRRRGTGRGRRCPPARPPALSGPATPVTETATSQPSTRQAPRAMAMAASSDTTGPSGTPTRRASPRWRRTRPTPRNTSLAPGTSVSRAAMSPPVTDSASPG